MKALRILTIFTGSFLAFGVQPLVGRTLLPAFGGMAAVWVTCLAAFQMLLLGGYWYAHILAGRPGGVPRGRLNVHVALIMAAAVWLGVVAERHAALAGWAASVPYPALGAILAVAVLVAGPYLLLSANASLVQAMSGGDYRLYAVSNAGSFAGLLAYPLVFELYVGISGQWLGFAFGMAAYGVMLACVGKFGSIGAEALERKEAEGRSAFCRVDESRASWILWLALPAVSCFLLNAVTAHLTSNVAPIPLMWAVLLALYLASYIVGFSRIGEKFVNVWLAVGIASVAFAVWSFAVGNDTIVRYRWNIAACPLCLMACCTALHSWLYRVRPDASGLTRYYLCLSIGGAAGGVLSSVVAPLVFDSAREYPLALACVCAFCVMGLGGLERLQFPKKWQIAVIATAVVAVLFQEARIRSGVLAEGRTFYGAWCVGKETVVNQYGKRYEMFTFKHGGTMHGFEPVDKIYRDGTGTSYFGKETAGMLFELARKGNDGKPLRVGIIGLGIGTMACYGKPGDQIRFWEICPQVTDVAVNGKWFDFVSGSKGKVEVKSGDARKSLEAERDVEEAPWDVLVVDAYSGDSIPMHLITQEAFNLYSSRLKRGGILALHISNWNIDLLPVVKAAAKHLGRHVDVIQTQGSVFTLPATWAFISEDRLVFPDGTYRLNLDEVRDCTLPTDAKGSLLPFVNWGLK